KIEDYVNNLKAFTAGYAASRPTAVAQNDIEVISLPGPNQNATTALGSLVGGEWSYLCGADSDHAGWERASIGCTKGGVAAQPSTIRVRFSLDPWGRLSLGIGEAPLQRRFNGRWTSLAVNLVGTGVRDCTKAADPNGCYAQGFLRYYLTHIGPAWITDSDEVWRVLDVPTGRIEAGKALAAELWLDPLRDGWATS